MNPTSPFRKVTICALLLLSTGLFSCGAGAQESIDEIRLRAESGAAPAQAQLGHAYRFGTGVKKDSTAALKWYRLAADQGNVLGQVGVGTMYANGEGIPKDPIEAVKYYRLAADAGNLRGMSLLAGAYAAGSGVSQNLGEALRLRKKAADLGSPAAYYELGNMYAAGVGVAKDSLEAVKWYHLAAAMGDSKTVMPQYYLGNMYSRGAGVPVDRDAAAKWYRIAAERGHGEAQLALGKLLLSESGPPKNEVEGFAWLMLATADGDKAALLAQENHAGRLSADQMQQAELRRQELFAEITLRKSQPLVWPNR